MINRRKFIKYSALTALYTITFPSITRSISLTDDYDELLCRKKFKLFTESGTAKLAIGDAIVETGKSFIGTDYEAGTLDRDMKEMLVVNLTGLDCVTFVENSLVFARCIKSGKTSFDDYKSELQKIRYRNGTINGYSSRLHYFCDWIYDNQLKGIVKDITHDCGGILYEKKINFMSANPKLYKQLSDTNELQKITETENEINSRKLYYIPRKDIPAIYDYLRNGDIIATTTSIKGLDVSHTGLVVKQNGSTYFLHASSRHKQVVISENELAEYIGEDSKRTGIMVARALEV